MSTSTTRAVNAGFAVMALVACGWVAALTGLPVGPLDTFFEKWASPTLIFAAAAACLARVMLVRTERVVWLLAGVAIALWGSGLLYFTVFQWDLAVIPVPSIADAFWLAFYPPAYAALALLAREHARSQVRAAWVDGLIAALAIGGVGAAAVLPTVTAHLSGSALSVMTNLAYPFGDLLLASLVAGVVVMTGAQVDRRWAWIGAGLMGFAVADGIYLYQISTGTYQSGTVLEAGWAFATAAIAWAAWRPPGRVTRSTQTGWRTIGLPIAFGAVALGVQTIDHFSRVHIIALVLSAACLAAVMVRLALTFGQNVRMLMAASAEASTDALTGLANRRRLMQDMAAALSPSQPQATLLVLLDLNGFKAYNDAFGHPAGDALLTRLGARLTTAFGPGRAYRLGGDEFCLLVPIEDESAATLAARSGVVLAERGEGFSITSSFGYVSLPAESHTVEDALRIADHRMYAQKHGSRASTRREATDILLSALAERNPSLGTHMGEVAEVAVLTAEALGLSEGAVELVRLTAELHDIGKVAIPDSILDKTSALTPEEWVYMRQHTIIGERILSSGPSLAPVGRSVRSTHERWDGDGYPDQISGEAIPLASRIVAVSDAYEAMTEDRPYRRALAPAAALAELRRCAGSQFDPDVVAAFVTVVSPEHALVAA